MDKSVLRIGLLLLAVVFLTNGALRAQAQDKQAAADQAKLEKESTLINAGDIAPDFTVQMLDGKTIKLSELKGKVVLLNF